MFPLFTFGKVRVIYYPIVSPEMLQDAKQRCLKYAAVAQT